MRLCFKDSGVPKNTRTARRRRNRRERRRREKEVTYVNLIREQCDCVLKIPECRKTLGLPVAVAIDAKEGEKKKSSAKKE